MTCIGCSAVRVPPRKPGSARQATRARVSVSDTGICEFSARTGRIVRTLDRFRLSQPGGYQNVLWTDATGGTLIVSDPRGKAHASVIGVCPHVPGRELTAEAIMNQTLIGVLHPGEMGAAVGGCLTRRGFGVLWASAGRSPDTAARAAAAGLRDVGTAGEMARQADVILSVCPPHTALAVARSAAGFGGIYVDANAVSPATSREVATTVEAGGAGYVDGGIIGAPPRSPGDSRLYLSGLRAAEIADLFAGTALDAQVIGDQPGAASAVKMAYAAWTKGTAALILAIRALARAEGVEQTLIAEWQQSQPALTARPHAAARSAMQKGWRWVAEMEEIAATMAAAGLPPGFHQAAAAIYTRVPHTNTESPTHEPSLTTVINALLTGSPSA
jgi:3-hydroxyisobutyrate dehydrogenase-like beta-hydroxyacid dehydrogenase